jgi:hypothetical protein
MGWLKDVTKFKDRHGNTRPVASCPREFPATLVVQSSVASSSHVQLEHLQHSLNPLQPIASNFINTFALGSSYILSSMYNDAGQ